MQKLRVAHMSLPFYNGGGLIRYVKDITNIQKNDENIEYVCIFSTGAYKLFNKRPSISYEKNKVDIFNVNNFSPTTLLEGTLYPEKDIKNDELEDIIINKLKELKINVVHFHTFHGFTANILKKIKAMNIKIIYTAHDYQPICNRITMLDYNQNVCKIDNNSNCNRCNQSALNYKRLKLRYNKLSNYLKTNNKIKSTIKSIVSKNKSSSKSQYFIKNIDNELFIKRRNEYISNLNNYIDTIICSSCITKDILKNVGIISKNIEVIPISNHLINNKLINYSVEMNYDNIEFGYLGGNRVEKGYQYIIEVFEKLYLNNFKNWKLNLLGPGSEKINIPLNISNNIEILGHQNEDLYSKFQVLIIPSIWPETFNFVALEGLINKKLIISSNIVGSMDLYKDSGSIIYKYNDKDELYNKIQNILKNKGKIYSIDIEENKYSKDIDFNSHYKKIVKLYKNNS